MIDKIHLNCYVNKISYMTSVNKKEIEKFSKMAEEWWDPNGKFKPLHKFNPIRIRYIKDNIINHFN
jgi:2-polyprenyl-6-hydroxyphenyl methylase / 3-demethylubiquinone-9 3-methyltransferase